MRSPRKLSRLLFIVAAARHWINKIQALNETLTQKLQKEVGQVIASETLELHLEDKKKHAADHKDLLNALSQSCIAGIRTKVPTWNITSSRIFTFWKSLLCFFVN